jgi:hypothetical protein
MIKQKYAFRAIVVLMAGFVLLNLLGPTSGVYAATASTFVQEAETGWGGGTKTTAAFNVQTGDILVAYAVAEDSNGSTNISVSGGSLTWTSRQNISVNAFAYVGMWTAVVDTSKSMSVTFSISNPALGSNFGANVLTFRGSDGVGASVQATGTGAPSVNISTTQVNSAIVVVNGDWNSTDGTSRTWRNNAGAFTEQTYNRNASLYAVYGGYHADAGAIGTYAVGLSAPTGQKYSIAAIEIKGLASGTADTTPPTVSISSPTGGSTVSGTTTVSANASDNVGVGGVQFKLDGNNLGAEDTSSPYSVSWDTTTASNASHTLTAVARDIVGNTTTSSSVSVTVSNVVAPPPPPPPPPAGTMVFPTDRDASANWKMAGLQSVGGIPNRTTQCGATLSPRGSTLDDTSAIQSAINSCPVGQVVQLAAGTFTINSNCININKGVVLRGAGPGQTILNTSNGAKQGSVNNGAHSNCVVRLGGGGNITNTTNLTSDGAQGAYSVTVASTTGISPGSLVLVDELALGQPMPDGSFNNGTGSVWAEPDYRVVWNAHQPAINFFDSTEYNNNFTSGDACAYSVRCGGVTEELHLVTGVSGNTITFDSPLTLSFRTAYSAQVRVYSQSSIAQYAGLEKVSLSGGDSGNAVFQGCVYCWVKNIESSNWLNAGAVAFYHAAFRDQLDSFYLHNAAWPVNGGGGYAINMTYGASEDYIVNGIDMLANKVVVVRASGAGTVFAYNYLDDGYINGNASWVETGMNCSHLGGSHGVLFEGNYSWNIDSDFTHGSVGHCTYFRNHVSGFRAPFTGLDGVLRDDSKGCCGPQRAISDHPYSYWDSFIGNIAGLPGKMSGWTYNCARGNANYGCAPAIFALGWNDSSVAGSIADATMNIWYPAVPTGTITAAGCTSSGSNCVPLVDGNYNYLTNSIQWATSNPSHILPTSLYLTSKPTFFGSCSWPWVEPTTGTLSTLPAKARFEAGSPGAEVGCAASTNPPPPPPPSGTPVTGDINMDHIVNSIDYSLLNAKWFTADSTCDLNHDGLVNAIDYSILNANWFKTW